MKIIIKTLKGAQFDLQAESTDTVLSLKKQIESSQGADAYPHSHQRLIFQGKVLKDDQTLQESSVTEEGFLVVMVTKPKAAAPAPAPASAPSAAPQTALPSPPPAPAPVPAAAPAPVSAPPATPPTTPSPTPAAPAPAPASAPTAGEAGLAATAASTVVVGSQLESTVQQLVEMGGGSWTRETVMSALRAAYNNPERAVEYLYTSIPATEPPPAAIPVAAGSPAAVGVPAGNNPVAGPNVAPLDLFPQGMPQGVVAAPGAAPGEGGGGELDFLRTHPQFQALRAMVRANPQILPPMLQELAKQNPDLMRSINNNQEEFLRLINEGPEGEVEGLYPMTQDFNFTPEENEAIERLEALGFERAAAVEAYLACDKNEQLAANYLFESTDFDS